MKFVKSKEKIITSNYIPKNRASKSDTHLVTKLNDLSIKKNAPEKAKSSLDIPSTQQNPADADKGKNYFADGKPHTPIVYDNKTTRLATLGVKILRPLEKLLDKFKLFLFKRNKNVRVNTDRHWYKRTKAFKDTYNNAVESKTFVLKGRPKFTFPDPVPKVVLFSFRYPSPYPYIYHRVLYKYEKSKGNNPKEKNPKGKRPKEKNPKEKEKQAGDDGDKKNKT